MGNQLPVDVARFLFFGIRRLCPFGSYPVMAWTLLAYWWLCYNKRLIWNDFSDTFYMSSWAWHQDSAYGDFADPKFRFWTMSYTQNDTADAAEIRPWGGSNASSCVGDLSKNSVFCCDRAYGILKNLKIFKKTFWKIQTAEYKFCEKVRGFLEIRQMIHRFYGWKRLWNE